MATKPADTPVKAASAKPKAAKEAAAPKKTTKAKVEEGAAPKRTNAGLSKPVQPSKELAAIIGKEAMPRTEVISKVWDYIRKHDLQNPADKREIVADKKLHAVFGKDKATMFEMNKLLSAHLS